MAGLLSFRRKIRSGYVLSFLLLLLSFGLLFYVQERLVNEAGSVIHNYQVISNAGSLRAEMTDAETGLRGYVITKDPQFLQPYNDALKRLPALRHDLKELTSDNAAQTEKVKVLDRLIDRKLVLMENAKASFTAHSLEISPEMMNSRQETLLVMDSIRHYVTRVIDTERGLMAKREKMLSELFSRARMISAISLAIIFIALLYSLVTFNRENKAREIADNRAVAYRMELESNQDELRQKNIELKELKEVEKFTSTGRIARTIAHEVRNPLTNILLATDQLREIETKSEESPVLLELINRNAARINQLVSDLLNATRFTHLDFSRTGINEVLEEALEMARDRIELSQVKVERSFTTEPCDVYVDREKIKVAILNIIVNAIEAMEKENKWLRIRTAREGSKCIIEIRDNGKGMDEEMLSKLFEPYITSKQKGNGLGLTNTQNIILNHKGKITVISELDKGSVFTITLDLATNNPANV